MEEPLKYTVVGIDIGPVNYAICKVTATCSRKPSDHGDDLHNPIITIPTIEIGYWKKHSLLEGTEYTNAMKVPITTLTDLLVKKLANIIPELLCTGHRVDDVLIENQIDNICGINGSTPYGSQQEQGFHQSKKDPKGINVSLSAATFAFFKTLKMFGSENKPPSHIDFQNAKHKYKLISMLPGVSKKEIREKNMFLVQRVKQMLSDRYKLKTESEKYSRTGEFDPLFDRAGIAKHLPFNSVPYNKPISSYDFNKKLGPLICQFILVRYGLDDIANWFEKHKKKDDLGDSLIIAFYRLVEVFFVADFSTQEIFKTIKKPRKKRAPSAKKTTTKSKKQKIQTLDVDKDDLECLGQLEEFDIASKTDTKDDFNIFEKSIDL